MTGEQNIVQRLSRLDTCAVAAEIRKGQSVSTVMGLTYESMLKDGGKT